MPRSIRTRRTGWHRLDVEPHIIEQRKVDPPADRGHVTLMTPSALSALLCADRDANGPLTAIA
jgi:hypothetical protein